MYRLCYAFGHFTFGSIECYSANTHILSCKLNFLPRAMLIQLHCHLTEFHKTRVLASRHEYPKAWVASPCKKRGLHPFFRLI